MDGQTDILMDRQIWMEGRADILMDRQMEGRMDGGTEDRQIAEQITDRQTET